MWHTRSVAGENNDAFSNPGAFSISQSHDPLSRATDLSSNVFCKDAPLFIFLGCSLGVSHGQSLPGLFSQQV